MKNRAAEPSYIDKAMLLSKEDAERVFSRMRGKVNRRLEDMKLSPIEAIAIQLELEDEQLKEWRARLSEIRAKHKS